jgi:fluoroacetyl-CoA thioesterase
MRQIDGPSLIWAGRMCMPVIILQEGNIRNDVQLPDPPSVSCTYKARVRNVTDRCSAANLPVRARTKRPPNRPDFGEPLGPAQRNKRPPPQESKTEQRKGVRVRTVPIGAQGSFTLVVPQRLASEFEDAVLPDARATPVLVMVIENAALAALEPYLEAGETAVGTCVDIRHLAPTLIGMRVFGEASVTRVEGRQVQFHVRAVDEGGQIGAGSHERMVVDAARAVRDQATGCEDVRGVPVSVVSL